MLAQWHGKYELGTATSDGSSVSTPKRLLELCSLPNGRHVPRCAPLALGLFLVCRLMISARLVGTEQFPDIVSAPF
jgi:hypothetical protein